MNTGVHRPRAAPPWAGPGGASNGAGTGVDGQPIRAIALLEAEPELARYVAPDELERFAGW
jgi:hypothetical protein